MDPVVGIVLLGLAAYFGQNLFDPPEHTPAHRPVHRPVHHPNVPPPPTDIPDIRNDDNGDGVVPPWPIMIPSNDHDDDMDDGSDDEDCGVHLRKQNRVIGGVDSKDRAWPWQTYMGYKSPDGKVLMFGASLIRVKLGIEKSDILVTCAHCVTDVDENGRVVYRDPNRFFAYVGSYNMRYNNMGDVKVEFTKFLHAEDYDPKSLRNDIALVKLSAPVPFRGPIKPVCRPKQDANLPIDKKCVITGFGNKEKGGGELDPSDELQQLNVEVHKDGVCTENDEGTDGRKGGWGPKYFKKEMMCGGKLDGTKGACTGDFGGPLACLLEDRWTLYGVLSFGPDGCSEPGKPDVVARVSHNAGWITREARKLSSITETEDEKCGEQLTPSKYRVIGGKDVEDHSWPWQAVLGYKKPDGNTDMFGASLIRVKLGKESSDILVTCAHCVTDVNENGEIVYRDFDRFFVYLGTFHLTQTIIGEIKTNVSGLYHHDDYDPKTYRNDIALVKLGAPVPFGNKIMPICRPKQDEDLPVDDKCVILGWGNTKKGGSGLDPSSYLQQLKVKVHKDDVCVKNDEGKDGKPSGWGSKFFKKEMMCAGELDGTKGACTGDFGGPVACRVDKKWILQGVLSFGADGCGEPGKPDVAARVSTYATWITDEAKKLSAIWKK